MIDTYRRQKTKLDDETRGNVGHKIQKLDIINYSYASGLAPGIAVGDGRGSKSSEAIRFAIPLQHSCNRVPSPEPELKASNRPATRHAKQSERSTCRARHALPAFRGALPLAGKLPPPRYTPPLCTPNGPSLPLPAPLLLLPSDRAIQRSRVPTPKHRADWIEKIPAAAAAALARLGGGGGGGEGGARLLPVSERPGAPSGRAMQRWPGSGRPQRTEGNKTRRSSEEAEGEKSQDWGRISFAQDRGGGGKKLRGFSWMLLVLVPMLMLLGARGRGKEGGRGEEGKRARGGRWEARRGEGRQADLSEHRAIYGGGEKIEEKLYSDAATDSAYIEEYDSKCGSGVIGWTSFGRFY
ncbi:hypothetical protein MPTK1_5g06460 [Marchantia polymorpha subsp. ruderalis]|uniref:Uncharacterized protein n=2 Tax=Marchantia polymorpha TaxID=3197 RepID=A0AAF6BFK6_MARPO|nr:hypothetical protein MARPO_0189s0008 [Marchantia polymorpha]BBN10790.1 hypothetical protein Mp_5g06460 [Marchantia polymorpha subsp. ruderalis]|eukprot:PTQ27634.1 hypothetical protein MARPO_0189s0008 [Marchantia polymorpha]